MLKYIPIGAALLLASPALAEGTVEAKCRSLGAVTAEAERAKQPVTELTHDQWEFMRGIFVRDPNTPDRFPVGDRGVIIPHLDADGVPDGVAVWYVDGDQACDGGGIPMDHVWMLEAIRRNMVVHPDAASQDHGT